MKNLFIVHYQYYFIHIEFLKLRSELFKQTFELFLFECRNHSDVAFKERSANTVPVHNHELIQICILKKDAGGEVLVVDCSTRIAKHTGTDCRLSRAKASNKIQDGISKDDVCACRECWLLGFSVWLIVLLLTVLITVLLVLVCMHALYIFFMFQFVCGSLNT